MPKSAPSGVLHRKARKHSSSHHGKSTCPHTIRLLCLLRDQVRKGEKLFKKLDNLRDELAKDEVQWDIMRGKRRGSPEERGIQEGSVSELELFRRGLAPVGPWAAGYISSSQVGFEPADGPSAPSEPVSTSDDGLEEASGNDPHLTMGRLSGFPKLFGSIDDLPASFCAYNVGHHGALFTSHWTFPLPDSNDVVVIAGTASRGEARKRKVNRRLELMSMGGTSPIEVVFPANGSGGLTYLGAYTPQGVWLSFTQENIGDMQALFDFWADVSDPRRVEQLRLRSNEPENEIRYCVLKYAYFNAEYFDSLQTLAQNTTNGRPRKHEKE